MKSEQLQNPMSDMMEKIFDGISTDDRKEMMLGMMGKMCEGVNMKEMMPMIMGKMMQGSAGHSMPEMMPMMMGQMKQGGAEQSMPEMMLNTMMPHCIGMMLPGIDADKRGEVAAKILSAVVEKGVVGLSGEQKKSFLETLKKAIESS